MSKNAAVVHEATVTAALVFVAIKISFFIQRGMMNYSHYTSATMESKDVLAPFNSDAIALLIK